MSLLLKLILFYIITLIKIQLSLDFLLKNDSNNCENIIISSSIKKNKIFLEKTQINQKKNTKESLLIVKNNNFKTDYEYYWDDEDFKMEYQLYNNDFYIFINWLLSFPMELFQLAINFFINSISIIMTNIHNSYFEEINTIKNNLINIKNNSILKKFEYYWDHEDFKVEYKLYNNNFYIFINWLLFFQIQIFQLAINFFINSISIIMTNIHNSYFEEINTIENNLININNSLLTYVLKIFNLTLYNNFFWKYDSFYYELNIYIKKIILIENLSLIKNFLLDLILNKLDYINISLIIFTIIFLMINLLIYLKIIAFDKNTIIKSLITGSSLFIYYELDKNIKYEFNNHSKFWDVFI